jgi:hypothetical protein
LNNMYCDSLVMRIALNDVSKHKSSPMTCQIKGDISDGYNPIISI